MAWVRWLHWINVIAAVLLIIAPFVLGYSDIASALWTSIVLGVVVGVLSLIMFFVPSPAPTTR